MLVLVAAVAGHAMNHIFLSGSLLILPDLKAALGISNTGVGLIAATRDVFSGLVSFPAGFVSDRFAGKLAGILGISVIGLGVCMFLVGVSTTFWMALVSITLLGMVIVLWHPPALATVSLPVPGPARLRHRNARHGRQHRRGRWPRAPWASCWA